jgi:hypothetical protein
MPTVQITSFGYLHADPPPAQILCDLRVHFRDPHWRPELRQLTARDEPVAQAVMATPGIPAVVDALAAMVHAYLAGPTPAPLAVAIGCAGGRRRSSPTSRALAALLRADGLDVVVVDRDIDLPVVDRPTTALTPPRVVCLCGSTRFWPELAEANVRETANGAVVLAPGCDLKQDHPLWADPDQTEALKGRLDQLHRDKIRLADEIVVVSDASGYYGESTSREIALAHELGKPVRYLQIDLSQPE